MATQGSLLNLILTAVGLAMGVAVIVLSILNTATSQTLFTLLGVGLFGLGLAGLNNRTNR